MGFQRCTTESPANSPFDRQSENSYTRTLQRCINPVRTASLIEQERQDAVFDFVSQMDRNQLNALTLEYIIERQESANDRELARRFMDAMRIRDGISWRIRRGFSRIGIALAAVPAIGWAGTCANYLFQNWSFTQNDALVFTGLMAVLCAGMYGFFAGLGWVVAGFFRDTALPPS
jgi:hypothetical protein